MKKNFLFIATAIAATLLFSCKKESVINNNNGNGNGPVPEPVSKIKTVSVGSLQHTLTHDALGRRTQAISNSGSKFFYDYTTAGKVTYKQFNDAGVNDITAIFDLSADGLDIKETLPSSPSQSATRSYNSDKQVAKVITDYGSQVNTEDYFYSKGNCDSIRHSTDGNWVYTVVQTYYTDKLNSLTNDALGLLYYGKSSKNLVKTEQSFYPGGGTGQIANMTYEFDAKDRVIKKTTTKGANVFINLITYF